MSESRGYEGWAIVELMGHRRLGGKISEATIAGAPMLRIDVPSDPPATQFYGGSAIYCITPSTEEIATALAKRLRPEPVQRWELPAIAAKVESPGSWGCPVCKAGFSTADALDQHDCVAESFEDQDDEADLP